MPFQSTIYPAMGFGVPGDLYNQGPTRSRTYILNSVSAANNVVGSTCCTLVSEGIAQAGNPSVGIFVGMLVNSKVYASYGTTGGGPLAPTLTLANNTQAELLTMGTVVALLTNVPAIGDSVIFDNTTGAMSSIAPGASLPSGKTFAQAVVVNYQGASNGLCVITFTDTLITPVPAGFSAAESEMIEKNKKGAK